MFSSDLNNGKSQLRPGPKINIKDLGGAMGKINDKNRILRPNTIDSLNIHGISTEVSSPANKD